EPPDSRLPAYFLDCPDQALADRADLVRRVAELRCGRHSFCHSAVIHLVEMSESHRIMHTRRLLQIRVAMVAPRFRLEFDRRRAPEAATDGGRGFPVLPGA